MNEALNLVRQRVLQWQKAAPELDKIRDEEIRNANTQKAMRFFQGSVLEELKRTPASLTSGLAEQQRYFRKLRA